MYIGTNLILWGLCMRGIPIKGVITYYYDVFCFLSAGENKRSFCVLLLAESTGTTAIRYTDL